MSMTFKFAAALAVGILAASAVQAAESPDVAAGRRIAQRNCGGCHAVTHGRSPWRDAPPFRLLHRRYPPGGLEQILREGMLAPDDPSDEAAHALHPRMPQVALGDDEVSELTAYLKSLEPPVHKRGR
jgi:mono/diheme cytochrome c family protein